MTATARTRTAMIADLSKGDMFLVAAFEVSADRSQVRHWFEGRPVVLVEFLAAHFPSDGTVAVWVRTSSGDFITLRHVARAVVQCPIYGS